MDNLANTKTEESVDEIIQDALDNIDAHIHGPDQNVNLAWVQNLMQQPKTGSDIPLRPSDVSSSETFHKWMSGFELDSSKPNLGRWHRHQSRESVEFYLTNRPMHLDEKQRQAWPNVQIIGRFCSEALYAYKAGLLDFCLQARQVFLDQPTRLFLHGLYLRGCLIEIWTFDRSGIQCSQQLDINLQPHQFAYILHNLQNMTSKDLGQHGLFSYSDSGLGLKIESLGTPSSYLLHLEDEPIARSEDIVGEGMTCYRARAPGVSTFDLIVKLKWRLDKERPEEQLLKLAEARGAQGTLSLRYEKTICSTSDVRKHFQIQPYRKFCGSLAPSDQNSDGAEKEKQELHSARRGILACTEQTGENFENRILTMVVLSPAGRPLQSFQNKLELLQALHDAVKAHRSLFQTAKILHQDVSSGNIIIVDPVDDDDDDGDDDKPHSILIDLDVAIDLTEIKPEPGSITGTRPYMAIGVLLRRRHTYRHDLESFLYVFLRTIIADGADNPPPTSRLRQWTQGSFHQSAMLKLSDMEVSNFPNVLAEFPERFVSLKPLAEQLRQILFPVEDGQLSTATDGSLAGTNALYDGIIGAFDQYIALEKA